MKTILLTLTLLTSLSSFSQNTESEKDILRNKMIQKNITKEISRLSSIDTRDISIEAYVEKFEAQCLKKAKDNVELIQECEDKIETYFEISDVQTIIDIQISELQELQSSVIFTALVLFTGDTDEEALLLLPLAMAVDIITLPFFLIGSLFSIF